MQTNIITAVVWPNMSIFAKDKSKKHFVEEFWMINTLKLGVTFLVKTSQLVKEVTEKK